MSFSLISLILSFQRLDDTSGIGACFADTTGVGNSHTSNHCASHDSICC